MEASMFLASSYWRGSMNVKAMRLFNTLDKAVDYVITLGSAKSFTSVVFYRIYELSENNPPILKTNDRAVIDKMEKAWGI